MLKRCVCVCVCVCVCQTMYQLIELVEICQSRQKHRFPTTVLSTDWSACAAQLACLILLSVHVHSLTHEMFARHGGGEVGTAETISN